MEPSTGIEPVTPSLPWTCSTTELGRLMWDETKDRIVWSTVLLMMDALLAQSEALR